MNRKPGVTRRTQAVGPRERLREGTGLLQGRKRGYILSFLHREVKEISAVIWISENGLEEVGLDYWKDSLRANSLWLLFIYLFCTLELDAELFLENYLESGCNHLLSSAFPISVNHDQRITLVTAVHVCHFQKARFIYPWFERVNGGLRLLLSYL